MGIRHTIVSWTRSLSGRVLISIVLIHVVLMTGLFHSVLRLVENNYTEQFVDDIRTDSQRVSQLVTYEIINNDLEKLKKFSEDLLLGGDLVSIVIKNKFGKIIYPEGTQLNEKFQEDFFFGDNGNNLYFIKSRLIANDARVVGSLQLAYDETTTIEEVDVLYKNGFVIAAIYLFIVIVFMGAVDTYLTQPLRNLTRGANRIASGKYNESFKISTNVNEVKILADSLEVMRNELVSRGEKLSDRERRIRALVNSITDAVIVCDLDGNMESVNHAAATLTSYSIEFLAKNNIGELLSFAEVSNTIKNPNADKVYETLLIDKNGEKIPVEVNVSGLTQRQGVLLIVLLRDIRDRKRNEMERYQYYNDMAHAGRLGIMGEMAAGIAHELNQPLGAISLYLQGCIRSFDSNAVDLQEIMYAINSADEQATRAAGIIRRIKGFVRKETENGNLEVVDANMLIKRSVEFVLLDTKYSIIQPELVLTSRMLEVKVDSLQIEQVLVNLIRNAIEAILSQNERSYFLKISSDIDVDGNIKICVTDSGSGVESKNINKIFDTYFSTKEDGLGMGLAICRSIIEEHDGVLQYAPSVNYGSEFYFTLPLYVANFAK
ncbi:hypothetical protein MNBD_GAMMA22-977 [hydrothermal vent metagenome]|uniref:histidine kinase n=1 Tax=hydrothermal vent metagenome TaxID=652676 RepID=A0A3B1AH07_9ZZZZ